MSRYATSTTSWRRIRISIIYFPMKSLALFPTPFLSHVWRIECQIKRDIPPKVLTQDRMKIRLTLLLVPETRIRDLTMYIPSRCIPAIKNLLDGKFSSIPCPLECCRLCVVIPRVAEPLAALSLLHCVFSVTGLTGFTGFGGV
ncbi:hypothetical protein M9H77_27572 [Catharanthus roseus]|uniref:Uncharacterized protein n=1 Tax=Catharanthus roseus TaxID=4058 RepID=A0ACC0ADA1_CATRO|nr:hypothetical protein M9H77_27572 [Catharanthus roseus]